MGQRFTLGAGTEQIMGQNVLQPGCTAVAAICELKSIENRHFRRNRVSLAQNFNYKWSSPTMMHHPILLSEN